ncbi:vesicle-associated protein 1-4-like [Cornus florida]|uniref:vesicle-associated protein 1-4-like n=1 Tax=Cornus florida TaxID=4283 RepID=UPI00289DB1C5|nr:vesicle-associated protein 1-4-like [Cornus florida]
MNPKLVDVQPQELNFIFELKKQISCCVQLINNSNHHVAFKVKTTAVKKYCVKPNTGTINPMSTCEITVTMQEQQSAPPDMICKDKFLVESTVVPVGTTNKDITASTFAKDDGKYIQESKLSVILGSKMNTELVDVQPRELRFKFELKKQISCCVQLINNSNHRVAFKVKTTAVKKYCVRPNKGTIDPKSTCEFTVTMQAQRSAPPDMICEDKFLVQSTVVPEGTTKEDITASTFAEDDGKYIQESKLRVILVSPPNPPVLSPISGTLKQVPAYEPSIPKDQLLSKVATLKDKLLSKVKCLTQRHTQDQAYEPLLLKDE